MSWIEVESKGRRRARPGEARAWVEAFLLAPEQTDSCIPVDAQVAEIRRRYAAGGIRQDDLAREMGVSQVQISRIVRGESWEGDGQCAM